MNSRQEGRWGFCAPSCLFGLKRLIVRRWGVYGEGEFDAEAMGSHVADRHCPETGFDGAFDDGEAQTGAASFASAGGFRSEEGFT